MIKTLLQDCQGRLCYKKIVAKRPISQLNSLKTVIENSKMKSRFSTLATLYQIQQAWPEIVGEMLASESMPCRLEKNVLHIQVKHSAVLMSFQFIEKQIIMHIGQKLNLPIKNISVAYRQFWHQASRQVHQEQKKNFIQKNEDHRSIEELIKSMKEKNSTLRK